MPTLFRCPSAIGQATTLRIRMKRLSIAVCVVSAGLASSLPASAQTTRDLAEVLSDVLRHDPRIDAAQANVRAAGTDIEIAEDGYWPRLESSVGTEDNFTEGGYRITLSQMLYDWGQVEAEVEQRRAERDVERDTLDQTRMEIAQEAITAYIDLGANRAMMRRVRDYIEKLESLETLANDRTFSGYGDRVELDRAAVDLASAREWLARLQGDADTARQELEILSGRPFQGVTLSAPKPLPIVADLARDPATTDAAITNAPAYRSHVSQQNAARHALSLSQAERWPELRLEATSSRYESNDDMVSDSSIGLRIEAPVFQGLTPLRQPEADRARLTAAQFETASTARELRRQIQRLSASQPAVEARIKALDQQARSGERLRSSYRDQFITGSRNIEDLLTIESEIFAARRQMIELNTQLLTDQYDLATQLGALPLVSSPYRAEAAVTPPETAHISLPHSHPHASQGVSP
ncbi:TolC family protein [Cobetia sp. ICG0124]|nr:TolC family protein [Cobetia sp. ICG0124]